MTWAPSLPPKALKLQPGAGSGGGDSVGPLRAFEEAVGVHLSAKRGLIEAQCRAWAADCQQPAMREAMKETASRISRGLLKL